MFIPVHSGPRPEPMVVGAIFWVERRQKTRVHHGTPWEANLTRGRNTRKEVIRDIKDEFIKKSKSDIYGYQRRKVCEISVSRENPAQSAQSKFQEEPEGIGEG